MCRYVAGIASPLQRNVPGHSGERIAYGVRLPLDAEAFIARGAGMGAVRTPMLQDYELGRPLALAAIGDAVLALAARKGIPMMTTADITALARSRGANRLQT